MDPDLEFAGHRPYPPKRTPIWPLFVLATAMIVALAFWPERRPSQTPMHAVLTTSGTNWACVVTDLGVTVEASAETPEAAFAGCIDQLD